MKNRLKSFFYKKSNKIKATLLIIILVFNMIPITVFAASAEGDFLIKKLTETTCQITSYKGKGVEVEIPDTINGMKVTEIGNRAFYSREQITSIIIPNSVISIGEWAFSGCTGLTSVTIPNSVTSIGEWTFSGCTGLTSVIIPNSVSIIGNGAFSGCIGLTNVTIPDSVTSIGGGTFSGCTGLTSVTIPNSVTSIGDNAFNRCTGLTSVTIPNSVTSIGHNTFGSCSGLTSITIPDTVTSIGDNAFSRCTGLTSVTIPSSLTSIGYRTFSGCTGLTSVTIPSSVTSIGDGTFSVCTGLTSVTIPNSVTSIGAWAFSGCTGLTSVTIPNSVTSIGDNAFDSCTGLTSVTIGNSVTSIGDRAFYGCKELTSVTIPNSVTSIAPRAFYYCEDLKIMVLMSDTPPSFGREFTNDGVKIAVNSESVVAAYEEELKKNINEYLTVYPYYNITKKDALDGSFEVDKTRELEGENVTINNINPDTDYEFDTVTVKKADGTNEIVLKLDDKYTFIMPAGEVSVEVTFKSIHNFGTEFTVDKEATCTEKGEKSRHCIHSTSCTEKTEVTVIPEKGHSYSEWNTTKETTCTEDGINEKTCSRCSDKVTEVISKLGHNWGDWIKGDENNHKRVCTHDVTHSQNVAHSFDNGKITTEATTEKEGIKKFTCTICGEIKTETIEKLTAIIDGVEDGKDDGEKDQEKPSESPKTGDETPIIPLAIVIVALGICMAVTFRKKVSKIK